MNDFQQQLIFELAKQYTLENFDFKAESPEDLILKYLAVSGRIEKVIKKYNDKKNEFPNPVDHINF